MTKPHTPRHGARLLLAATALSLLSACASLPEGQPRDERDPWERYNRAMFSFNDAVDKAVLKPVATAYREVLPSPVRTGVGNFFGNLGDVWSFVNNVLQGKPEGAMTSFWRVVINTTIGLGGVLNPATEMRLERKREDFGQTLATWGVGSGPYFVLPLLGPSTLRDTTALPVDWYGNPVTHVNDVSVRNALRVTDAIDTRAAVLGATDVLEGAALDPYSFQRDAFLQKRLNDVYDGDPPQNEERYDLDEVEADAPAETPAEKSAETPTEKLSDTPAEASTQAPAETPTETPTETPADTGAAAAEPAAAPASAAQ